MPGREETAGTVTGELVPATAAPGDAQPGGPRLRTSLNEAAPWLARLASNRWFSLALVAVIAGIDRALVGRPFGFLLRALLDEPCHLLTAVILLGAITRWLGRPPSRPFTWALLAASVPIDVDHLPAEFGFGQQTYGSLPRPYTHALWLLVLVILVAVLVAGRSRAGGRPRAALAAAILAGAAWGLAAHFLRDLATAPIALLWPLSSAWLQLPYGFYLAALLLMVALPLRRPARR